MDLPWRDRLATALVAVALVIYGAWMLGGAQTGIDARLVAIGVVVLGIGASLSAVVPNFDELIRGSRPYLVSASAFGTAALIAGIWAIVEAEPLGLTVLVLATIVLWAMSTARHLGVDLPRQRLGLR